MADFIKPKARNAGKRGKLPAARAAHLGALNDYLKNPLPQPPSSFDYASKVTNGFPMFLNDTYGDCAVAGLLHLLQIWYAEVGEVFTPPSDEEVKTTYFQLTGGEDTGLVLQNVLKEWQTTGLFGTKIIGYAPIEIRDTSAMKASAYAFGGLYLGVELPGNAEEQFEQGEPWHLEGGYNPPVGGHCIVGSGANRFGIDDLTWGAEDGFTWNWWNYYGSECWAVIPEIFAEKGHGPLGNIDIDGLMNDLKEI